MASLHSWVVASLLTCGCALRLHNRDTPRRGIPRQVFITGPFAEESEHGKRIISNVTAVSFLQTGSTRRAPRARFATLRREGATIRFFDDVGMNKSAYEISEALEKAGVVDSAFRAFALLRPMAFKADLWRYMVLWDQGGIYLDMNVRVLQNLSTWIDFQRDELLLIQDEARRSYWNAIMASTPRNSALGVVIREVVRGVLQHSYGKNDLDITGPVALYRILHSIEDIDQHITVQHKLYVRSTACGSFPEPPCSVEVVGLGPRNDGLVIARKDADLHKEVHGASHYSNLYAKKQVYCDDVGDALPACTSTGPQQV
mmetsp:Transcript_93220/g.216648  ORF Transcript_93220/g.216648 Transcript_93220/m.216648 type:complete len:315 (-) Transcript_93220:49-993(-)